MQRFKLGKKTVLFAVAATFLHLLTAAANGQVPGHVERLHLSDCGKTIVSRMFPSNASKSLVMAYFDPTTLDNPQDALYATAVVYAQKGGGDKARSVRFVPSTWNGATVVPGLPFVLTRPHDQNGLYINKLRFDPPRELGCNGGEREFFRRNPRVTLIFRYICQIQ